MSEAIPEGVWPDTRPVDYNFTVLGSAEATFETSRFSVDNGSVNVNSTASWNPSSPGDPAYLVTLLKWGFFSDEAISTQSFNIGNDSAMWSGLASGSYYLRVIPGVNLNAASLTGVLHVS